MKQTRLLMGMPITLEVVDPGVTKQLLDEVYAYFQYIDEKFSTYKDTSEISLLNNGQISLEHASTDMQTVFMLAEEMRQKTDGYFDIWKKDRFDPSGLVKGWAIYHAAEIVSQKGWRNFYVEAGGDIQAWGKNDEGQDWRVGIRSPFQLDEIVKVIAITDCGVATSGNYIRGQHIYNPKDPEADLRDILSLTVIGPDIYQADCYATAAFAMGTAGIAFIGSLPGFEGYLIDQDHRATFTPGFKRYVVNA